MGNRFNSHSSLNSGVTGHRRARAAVALFAVLAAATSVFAQAMTVTSDHADRLYRVGDTAHWKVEWTGSGAAPTTHYILKRGGLPEIGRGDLAFTNKVALLDSTFDRPDTVLVEVNWEPALSANRVLAGAVASPESIVPAGAEPADFDAFWQAKLAELAAVPANPQLESAESGRTGIDYWKITMDNIRGTHIRGQLARPSSGSTFPALLIVQYAGVYALQKSWVTDRAAQGWLALDLNAHDLPIDETAAFYQQQETGPLANYWNIGNDDPDRSYYLRMYLSCYRAIEYLRSRPDWDGRTIVVTGASQGGQQTLVTAGLHPDGVTAGLALVPAACDMLAPDAGRAAGFPNWYFNTAGKDPAKVRSASRYYDPANFARRIRCPMLIAAGSRDDLAPPSSVFAAANMIPGPKEVLFMQSGHQNEQGSQDSFNNRSERDWLPALRQGQPAPVASFPIRPQQVDVPSGGPAAQIVNLSTRGIVTTGEDALIAGFVIAGTSPKKMLILASGLNLRRFGITGEVGRPAFTLYRNVNGQNIALATNNDWQPNAAEISALIAQVGAQTLSVSSDPAHGDAGIAITLAPGVYTVVVIPDPLSANQDGVGLIELYDATPSDGSRLLNISSRGRVETGARQMIVGVVVTGSGQSRLLFRGVGPGLDGLGVSHYLVNPSETLLQATSAGNVVIATNDDAWNSAQVDQSQALAVTLGAFALAAYSADSTILQRVQPGVFTAIISPGGGTPGIGLAEIYDANVH